MSANGVPVRLSEALTTRARSVAAIQERSLTEQVEHWARLGQVVEAVVSAGTMERLKAQSHDPELAVKLAFADSAEGRASAAEMIRAENATRYEETTPGTIVAVTRDGKRSVRYKPAAAAGGRAAEPRGRVAAKSRGPGLRAVADSRAGMKLPRKRPKLASKR